VKSDPSKEFGMTGLVLSEELWGIGLIAFNELGEISHCVSK
jgi:hypothetical protein